MIHCWKCGKATGIVGRPARADDCRYCGASLRCCRECSFYDASKASGCAEDKAEPPPEKETVNFCDFFVAGDFEEVGKAPEKRAGPATVQSARSELDKLFKF